jgi:TolB-like protein
MVSLMEDELPPLEKCANVPAELDRIVTKALRKNQNERYQTASQLARDLKRLKQNLQLEARLIGLLDTVPTATEGLGKGDGPATGRVSVSATHTADGVTRRTSTAEYISGGFKRRKTLAIAAALIVLLLGAAVPTYFLMNRNTTSLRGSGKKSIAVLPFVNETGNADVEYLSDGLTETLISNLSQLPELKVTARNSTFKYKDKEVDAGQVARSLAVEAILIGRVSRHGDMFLVNTELINGSDSTRLWGEQYKRKESDLLAIEAEISHEIVQALRLRLTTVEQQKLAKRETVNPQAYELLLKGRFFRNKGGTENWKKGLEFFRQATAVDPTYALAYAELSRSFAGLVTNNLLDPKDGTPKAEEAARKALELDEGLAEAHLAMAGVKGDAWEWPAAEREYKRALELNPSLSGAHIGYTFYHMIHRRDEQALAEARRARELDPLSHGANAVVVYGLILAGEIDQAIDTVKKMLELDRSNPGVHMLLGQTYRRKAQYAQAIAAYQEAWKLGDQSPDTQVLLGQAYAMTGEPEKTRRILKRLENGNQYVSPTGLAMLYAALGEEDQALALLERGYAARDKDLIWLNVEQAFDPLRSDPRFEDLLRRIGLK